MYIIYLFIRFTMKSNLHEVLSPDYKNKMLELVSPAQGTKPVPEKYIVTVGQMFYLMIFLTHFYL